MRFGAYLVFGAWSLVFPARAHIGDQNVFFEGQAGPYPVRVVIRAPGVIPGLAEISVRVQTNGVQRVTVLPMRWNTGRQGAPPPDDAAPVRGETNLFSGELWFMRDGAQSVEVAVLGAAGRGTVIVPVNAVATRVLGMSQGLSQMLAFLGLLLVALAISIAGAAVRESVLPAGVTIPSKRRWLARSTVVSAALIISVLLWLGQRWWNAEANDFRNNRLFQPLEARARLQIKDGERRLRIERTTDRTRNTPLVPEHGKLMHLFLVREPGMEAFAHLHPTRLDWKTFETPIPELPEGEYRIYADVTYETGFSDTLIASIFLPAPTTSVAAVSRTFDVDDAWRAAHSFARHSESTDQTNAITSDFSMEFNADGRLVENRDAQLRFVVRDAEKNVVALESYMGMGGHLILRREDGAVFTHLHPSGSYSMAAQQLFELRAEGKAPLRTGPRTGEPICRLPALPGDRLVQQQISFPYAFPKAGAYRLWAQVKVNGKILTGVFDVNVAPAKANRYASAATR
ncbi:MAG TPA: hypothetical protein VNT99_13125 [Methylomirabilota bacterium]|nr:hypothetical protein [Methylomirabilota bacterium]